MKHSLMKANVFQIALIGVTLTCCAVSAASKETSRSPRDRATWQLATHTAARRALEAAQDWGEPGKDRGDLLLTALREAMVQNPHVHALRDQSLEQANLLIRSMLEKTFADRLVTIVDVANQQSPFLIKEEDVRRAATQRLDEVLQTSTKGFLSDHVSVLFKKARSQAVALERQAVDQRVTPPDFETLDAMLMSLKSSARLPYLEEPWSSQTALTLREELQPFSGGRDAPLLEEVEAYARQLADRMMLSIREQHRHQRETAASLLESPLTARLRQKNAIAEMVIKDLASHLGEASGDMSDLVPHYPLFGTVRAWIEQQAAHIETERLLAYLQTTPLLTWDTDEVSETLHSEIREHTSPDQSRERLLNKALPLRRASLAADYGETDETATRYFKERLGGGGVIDDAIRKRLQETLDPILAFLRENIVTSQYAESFEALARRESLPDALLPRVHEQRGALPETWDAARSWFEEGGVSLSESTLPDTLFQETLAKALAQAQALIADAHAVLVEQFDLLNTLENEQRSALRAAVEAGHSLDDLRTSWIRDLQHRWEASSHPDLEVYPRLTEPVLQALEKSLRQFYDALRQEQRQQVMLAEERDESEETDDVESDAKPVDAEPPDPHEITSPPPEQDDAPPQPEDTPSDELVDDGDIVALADQALPDLMLVLRDSDTDQGEVLLIVSGVRMLERSVSMEDPEIAAQTLFEALQPHLEVLLEQAEDRVASGWRLFGWRRSSSVPVVSVHIVVEGNTARHRMSLLLKQHVESELQRLRGDQGSVELHWQAGLTL